MSRLKRIFQFCIVITGAASFPAFAPLAQDSPPISPPPFPVENRFQCSAKGAFHLGAVSEVAMLPGLFVQAQMKYQDAHPTELSGVLSDLSTVNGYEALKWLKGTHPTAYNGFNGMGGMGPDSIMSEAVMVKYSIQMRDDEKAQVDERLARPGDKVPPRVGENIGKTGITTFEVQFQPNGFVWVRYRQGNDRLVTAQIDPKSENTGNVVFDQLKPLLQSFTADVECCATGSNSKCPGADPKSPQVATQAKKATDLSSTAPASQSFKTMNPFGIVKPAN